MAANLYDEIFQALTEALSHNKLDGSITHEMLPSLAKALQPHIEKYQARYGSSPAPERFCIMVNNFIKDELLVQAFQNLASVEARGWWQKLQAKLNSKTERHYPNLSPNDYDEIVGETLRRVQMGLANFLFLTHLETWIDTIWRNESNRLLKKRRTTEEREIFLDDEDSERQSLSDGLESPEDTLEDQLTRQEAIEDLWKRINKLGHELDVRILDLHLAGHTLEEIKQALGKDAPSVPTIMRRRNRIIERMKNDEVIGEIARRLGDW